MIRHRLPFSVARDPDPSEWDTYVNAHPAATLYHLGGWQRVLADTFGHESIQLIAREAGRPAGVLPLVLLRSRLFGRMLVSLPFMNYGGVLADSPEIERALVTEAVALAKREGVERLELRHVDDRPLGLVTRRHKVTFRLELPKDPDRLWAAFPAKLRSQIRKPEKEGLVARVGGAEELDAFYRVFAVNMRDLGTPVYPRQFFQATLDRLPEAARVVVVRRGTVPLAAAFLLSFRGDLEVPCASSLRRYNALGANMLSYWTALRHACETGHTRFDFGRSTPDSGPARFKAQWGAEAVRAPLALLAGAGPLVPRCEPGPPALPGGGPLLAAAPGGPGESDRAEDRAPPTMTILVC